MINRIPLTSLFVVSLAALVLTGCVAGLPASESVPSVESSQAPEPAPASAGPQPAPGAVGADAATQMIELRWDALVAQDWAAACSMYSTGFVERLLSVSSSGATDCEAALAAEAETVVEVLATAAEEGFAPRVPYYYVPSGIAVDSAALEVDSDALVYIAGTAVTSTDPFVFEEGASATPGWLTESTYVQLGEDGRWSYITPAERSE